MLKPILIIKTSFFRRFSTQQRLLNKTFSSSSIGTKSSAGSEDQSDKFASRGNELKTPLIMNKVDTEIMLGQPSGFSIPRPTIRPPVRL